MAQEPGVEMTFELRVDIGAVAVPIVDIRVSMQRPNSWIRCVESLRINDMSV